MRCNMLNRFQNGTIVEFQAGEDLKNNDLYVVGPNTRKIRKPRNNDEWLTCQLVYVNNIGFGDDTDVNWVITKDKKCRCWIGYLIV